MRGARGTIYETGRTSSRLEKKENKTRHRRAWQANSAHSSSPQTLSSREKKKNKTLQAVKEIHLPSHWRDQPIQRTAGSLSPANRQEPFVTGIRWGPHVKFDARVDKTGVRTNKLPGWFPSTCETPTLLLRSMFCPNQVFLAMRVFIVKHKDPLHISPGIP